MLLTMLSPIFRKEFLRRSLAAGALFLACGLVPGLGLTGPARAGGPLPRFASLSADKVYLRQGPSYKHRILWVYHRKGLPVEIVGQFDVWRRVRMPDGATGWIHTAMLSSARTVVVTGKHNVAVRADASQTSKILALAEPGVIAKLDRCNASACEVEASDTDGWIDKKNIWGVRLGENIH